MKLYDSKTGQKKEIETVEKNHLNFYACGPTVYSYAHIGNFRSFLTADLIVRLAKANGLTVRYVCNITDVGHLTHDEATDGQGQDKMVKALSSDHHQFANIWDLARFYTQALINDWQQLNLLEPDVRPRASEHVTEQIELIDQLVEQGFAYETAMGVYFDVEKYPNYGVLSKNKLSELKSGSRELVTDQEKRHRFDFALWKKDSKHLMRWYTRYGWGYPGWHIECSAMAMKYLGHTIDLHAGGKDNLFPHHECELAQSEAVTNETFAKQWVHTAHLLVDNQPMSKSKGNFYTVQDVLKKGIHPMALRHALTCAKYADTLNFTQQGLEVSQKMHERIQNCYVALHKIIDGIECVASAMIPPSLVEVYRAVLAAMNDDLNMPMAYAELLNGIKWINTHLIKLTVDEAQGCLNWFDQIEALLGIVGSESPQDDQAHNQKMMDTIETLIKQREAARDKKDFIAADKIRDQLLQLGIELKDTAKGVEWSKVKIGL